MAFIKPNNPLPNLVIPVKNDVPFKKMLINLVLGIIITKSWN